MSDRAESNTYYNEAKALSEHEGENKSLAPKLYLCATPIGNLGDVTIRVLETLKGADFIYCEDTRNTSALLEKLDIKGKKLISAHMHNEEEQARKIAELVRSGKAAAYVSDAGMPCISDPGERIVKHFIELGLPFEVLPGASAALTAAIYSGLSTRRIYFVGFLPRENKERTEYIAEIKRVKATIIIYESPYRIAATLKELAECLGDRQAAVSRELTKLYEQTVRGRLSELAARYEQTPPKGECVIALSGEAEDNARPAESMDEMLLRLMQGGMSAKDAAKQTALMLDVPKNTAYARATELKNG